MPKRRTWALGTIGVLLVAGVIVVVVLASLGYFNKKGGSAGIPSIPGSGSFQPSGSASINHYSGTCMPPYITSVTYSNKHFTVNHVPFSAECSSNDTRYDCMIRVDGIGVGESDAGGHVMEGQSSITVPLYPKQVLAPGKTYNASAVITINTFKGSMEGATFNFTFTA